VGVRRWLGRRYGTRPSFLVASRLIPAVKEPSRWLSFQDAAADLPRRFAQPRCYVASVGRRVALYPSLEACGWRLGCRNAVSAQMRQQRRDDESCFGEKTTLH